jgi:Glycosyl transferase family 2
MSPASIPWRHRWRVLTRPDALALRLRHALTLSERLSERVQRAFAAWQYRKNPQPVTIRLVRPAHLHAGPPELEAHLDPRDGLSAESVRQTLQASWPTTPDVLLILVRYRKPPLLVARTDAEVHSWAAAPEVRARIPGPESPLLAMLDAALRLPDLGVQVVQIGFWAPVAPATNPAASIAWVVPHRGHAPWLGECLARLTPQLRPAQGDEALVGLDEAPNLTVRALRATFPMCWFGALRRPGAGPFVVRQRAAERTTCDWLLFQDSDDLPTADRVQRLHAEAQQHPADALGSHELRLDYLTRRVLPIRFPLNASAALRVAMGHPALFPTLLVRRASLFSVGGFSTHLRFALDTQLLLRASFAWQIRNADAFLYLRRRRAGSLTTDPSTAIGSPAREQHRARWRADFAAVQAGALPLAGSSLTVQRGPEYQQNELEPI